MVIRPFCLLSVFFTFMFCLCSLSCIKNYFFFCYINFVKRDIQDAPAWKESAILGTKWNLGLSTDKFMHIINIILWFMHNNIIRYCRWFSFYLPLSIFILIYLHLSLFILYPHILLIFLLFVFIHLYPYSPFIPIYPHILLIFFCSMHRFYFNFLSFF